MHVNNSPAKIIQSFSNFFIVTIVSGYGSDLSSVTGNLGKSQSLKKKNQIKDKTALSESGCHNRSSDFICHVKCCYLNSR